MTESSSPLGTTAGGLLRAARERQGVHIAALAASIKVSPRKLDALERDRYDELPDPAFTRALAQAVCRSLKIDAGPVLALLPPAGPASLEHVAGSLNTPFRPGRDSSDGLAASAIRPLVWAGGALMVAALVIMFLPESWWGGDESAIEPAPLASAPASAPVAPPAQVAAPATQAASMAEAASAVPGAASVAASVAAAAPPVVETVFAAPPPAAAASEVTPASLLAIRVSETSWIEVRDASGSVLLSRSVQPGESVGLNGATPLRLTVGNAAGTQLSFRGQPVDLLAITRDNVARLELK